MSTHNILVSIKSAQIIPNLQLLDFSKGLEEEFETAVVKRAISVRPTEGLLYFKLSMLL